MRIRTVSLLFALWVAAFTPAFLRAAELIYVHERGCPYCRAWEAKVGILYDRTPEAARAPLVKVERGSAELAKLAIARPIRYTPTFILMEGGQEIGRIEGYPGEDFFWGLLGKLIEKLPPPQVKS
jgi:hypothetical protein